MLALLQQSQVQRAAQDALDCMDKQAVQAEAASEQLQELAMKVLEPLTCRMQFQLQRAVACILMLHAHTQAYGLTASYQFIIIRW